MAIRKIVARSIGVDVIVAEDLADNSITAAEITNGAVTADKLASNSVTTAKIAAGVTLTSPVMNTITSAAATALTLQSASTTAVTIDTSGNVGIGTASPTAKFNVFGTSQVLSNPAGTANDSNGFDTTTFSSSTPHWSYLSYNASHFQWSTYNIERMRIDSSGNLLIGKTTQDLASNGWALLPDEGSNYSFDMGGASNECFNYNNTGTGTYDIAFRYQTTVKGYIRVNSTNTTYSTTSDYRLKENIAPMVGALEKVVQLKPVTYTWKADGSDGQGFIAHELQAVIPDAVVGEKDAVETYTDEEGNEQTRIKPQGIDTSFLVATLTAAIQEQQALITSLTARITALEGA